MTIQLLVSCCCLVAAAIAAPYGPEGFAYTYHGKYPNKCLYDGIYYRDDTSFVFCSNGINHIQKCAPGTKNSAYSKFSYGASYRYRDFCDVNLVNSGYEAPKKPTKHEEKPKYEEPSYEKPKYQEPSYEKPKYQKPRYEKPKYQEPSYEKPRYEEPAYQKPKYQEPSYDAPKFYRPKYEEPKYEEPKYEEPKYEEPKYEEPKYEEPKYEEPKYEEPKYEPKYEEPKYEPKYEEPKYEDQPEYYTYHGMYPGKCDKDGLYYRDEFSFVYCSNGNHYRQPCAPGSKNSAYEKFSYGDKYSYRDFCDINLVDGGYASHDGYGYEYTKDTYKPEEPEYYAPPPKYEEKPVKKEEKYEEEDNSGVYTYHGKYPGKCEFNGLYYNNAESFVFCVNGLSYVQKCANGSRNSPYEKFSYGDSYSERDFCDVNLVDTGYVVKATEAAHAASKKRY